MCDMGFRAPERKSHSGTRLLRHFTPLGKFLSAFRSQISEHDSDFWILFREPVITFYTT
jgi:hypothetical protein